MLTRRGSRSRPVYLHQITREHFGVLQLVNYTPIKPKHNKGRWDPETPGFPRVQCEPHSRLSCSSCPLVSTTGTSAALRAEGTRQTRGERRPWASVLCSAPHPPGAPPPARLPPLRVAPSPLQHMCVLQSRHTNSEHWGLSRLRGERRPGFVGGVAAPQQQRAPAQAAQPPPADQHASRSIHPMPAASKETTKGHTGTGGRGSCCGWPWGPRASPAPVTRRSFCGRQLLLSPPSQTDAARAAAALPHDREACSRDTHPTRGCAALPQRLRATVGTCEE